MIHLPPHHRRLRFQPGKLFVCGLFAATYSAKGKLNDPTFSVNPLSVHQSCKARIR